jgi:SAM-dependent methyltransferase
LPPEKPINPPKEIWQKAVAKYHPAKYQKIKELLRYFRHIGVSQDCLDIGTGAGITTLFYRPFGATWNGVEPNRAARTQAQATLGFPVFSTLGEIPSRQFDLITVIDTFFHFPDPEPVIMALKDRLKPNGALVVMMMDGDPRRLLNRIRRGFGLNENKPGVFLYEPAGGFLQHFTGAGLSLSYYREYSFFISEFIIVLLDLAHRLVTRKKEVDDSLQFLQQADQPPVMEMLLLKIFFPFYFLCALVERPFKKLSRGYRLLAVFSPLSPQ